jgi:hypothetical protein
VFIPGPSSLGCVLWILAGNRRGIVHHRAVFNTNATPGAQIHVDAPGPFPNLHFEIPRGSLHRLKIRIGDEFDIQMPADLDQFRRDNSHGTVVGGKRLIQLGHNPADGRGFLEEIDVIPGIREIKGGLHSGDSSAHDQNRTFHGV